MGTVTMNETCPVNADLAYRDWEEYQHGAGRVWNLDYSKPNTSNDTDRKEDVELARCLWRAHQVEEAIGEFAPFSPFLRKMLHDLLLWVRKNPGRGLENYRFATSGSDSVRLMTYQLRALRDVVEGRLKASEGYPQEIRVEAAA